MSIHRKIWQKEYGTIPKDDTGRSYEIHHIDGNRLNNDLSNLKLVTIQEHFDIHYSQGDYGACSLISKRMNLPPEFQSTIQKGCKRPGIGGVKKGAIPWNKGLKQPFLVTDDLKQIRSKNSTGENNVNSKLTEDIVYSIIEEYQKMIVVPGINEKQKNGRTNSYATAYSKHKSKELGVTSAAIYQILKKKSWKYVWEKFEI